MSAREPVIRQRLQAIGLESFPDDTDVTWRLLGIVDAGAFSIVEAAPEPDTVGYPRFRFVLDFPSPDTPRVVGCYCWERGGRWGLLFADPGAPEDWKRLGPGA